MQLFERPQPPEGFDTAVKLYRDRVRKYYVPDESEESEEEAGEGEPVAVKKVEFTGKWKDYKTIFAEAQYGKCGYCEIMVIGGQPGDVEHYWPKGAVWQLKPDPSTWGQERKWASTVEGRQPEVISEQGYWWLAYSWENYLLSCAVCNEYWKISFFPIENDPRTIPPSEGTEEIPLMLNPFDSSRNPAEHLRFSDLGQIEAKNNSTYGYETIRTCGLDRESLRRSRKEKAQRAYKLASDFSEATDEQTALEILQDFYELGKDEYVHSGMVRIIFEELSGMSWEDLKQLVG